LTTVLLLWLLRSANGDLDRLGSEWDKTADRGPYFSSAHVFLHFIFLFSLCFPPVLYFLGPLDQTIALELRRMMTTLSIPSWGGYRTGTIFSAISVISGFVLLVMEGIYS
jgi:hypothetical protein